jgi:hypothetical protein
LIERTPPAEVATMSILEPSEGAVAEAARRSALQGHFDQPSCR